jgi:probable phosphoglycerate mutase
VDAAAPLGRKLTEIWLIRHGQTQWNTEKRFQGRQDSPLTELGQQQALAAGRWLATSRFSSAWCSPASRAQSTAALLNSCREKPLEFRTSEALAEMHFGEWEGRTRPEIEARWGEPARQFWNAPELWQPFGGESFLQAQERVTSFVSRLQPATDPVLLISHGMSIQLLLHAIRAKPFARLHETPFVLQASLTKLRIATEFAPSGWEIVVAGQVLS